MFHVPFIVPPFMPNELLARVWCPGGCTVTAGAGAGAATPGLEVDGAMAADSGAGEALPESLPACSLSFEGLRFDKS